MKLEDIIQQLNAARTVFENEKPVLDINSKDRLIFVGDTHGDYKTTETILQRYFDSDILVFTGDYVDRAPETGGSLKNILLLIEAKLKKPKRTILLRGNHEFPWIYKMYGFADEIATLFPGKNQFILNAFKKMAAQMPYVVMTKSGIVALHGGLPDIKDRDELKNIPKGVEDFKQHLVIDQIVWNDHSEDIFYNEGFLPNSNRGSRARLYGEKTFESVMGLLGKKVLIRGHDQYQKGFSFHDRLLTIFTSSRYESYGDLKGKYVAIAEPSKKIRTCKDLLIEYI